MKKASSYSRVVFYAALFVLLLILCTQFPYVSDDWAWGTKDSIESVFNYGNGRYLGNLLGFIAAKSYVFRCLYTAGIVTAIVGLCVHLSHVNPGCHTDIFLGITAAILLLTVSRDTFRQTTAWSAAFMNYGGPAALLLAALALLHERARGKTNPLFFFLPFVMSLFVENVTIGNVIFIAARIIYGFICGRKPSFNEWLYFAGALAGAAVMFTNPGYSAIIWDTSAESNWQAETSSLGSMISTGLATLKDPMAHLLLGENLVLTVFLTLNLGGVLLFALPGGKRRIAAVISYAWILGATAILIIRTVEPGWLPDLDIVRAALAVLVLGYLFLIPVLIGCTELPNGDKERMIVTWLLAAALAAPLPVAKPLSARAFYPIYTLLMLLSVQLFAWNLGRVRESAPALCVRSRGVVLFLAAVILFVSWGHWFSVYAVINHYDTERLKFVRTQEEEGVRPAVLPRLPYAEYLIVDYPSTNYWMECYQRFYDINLDLKINVCSFDEWMEMVKK